MFITSKTYIEYNNINNVWNDGYISVYVKGDLKEQIFVDDFMEKNTDEEISDVDDIIDKMKEKYHIDKVIYKDYNWR